MHIYEKLCSDLPGILSGDKVAFLDPHQAYFQHKEGNGPARPTSSYAFTLNSYELHEIPHQLEPFKQRLFSSDDLRSSWYDGTIFRLPLRQDASRSDLSSNVYGPEKIKQMLDMLRSEAQSLLLFLNNVESIEWYERSSRLAAPQLKFAVKIGDRCVSNVRAKRATFVKAITPHTERGKWISSSEHVTYELTTSVTSSYGGFPTISSSKHWLVTQLYQGGDNAKKLKKIIASGASKFLPWVGVALPLKQANGQRPEGQVFCFLPFLWITAAQAGHQFMSHMTVLIPIKFDMAIEIVFEGIQSMV